MNIEETKTAIGSLMKDLRGNWAYDYTSRIVEVKELAESLLKTEPEKKELTESLILICDKELEYLQDGRHFRGEYLYCYSSDEGRTKKVFDYLENHLTQPEYNQIEIYE